MKASLLLLLTLCLAGCLPSRPKVDIASGIPASDMACVKPQGVGQSEMEIRDYIKNQSASAFALGNFEELEKQYSSYRDRASRTPGGRWKLKYFYEGMLDRELFDLENERSWARVEAKLAQWIKAHPNSPAPYIAYSDFLIIRAWHFRGEEFASKVSRESWALFRKNIKLAKTALENSKEVASADPKWYSNMLKVAQAQGWSQEEVRELLQEALFKEAYYHDTYHAAFSYLLPKWHGSAIEAEQFAQDAARITSKCEGQSLYAQVHWTAFITNAELSFEPSSSMPVNWEKMSAGFADLIERYPIPWHINSYAKFACLAGDKAKTKELIRKIGNKPIMQAWEKSTPGANFSVCREWASET